MILSFNVANFQSPTGRFSYQLPRTNLASVRYIDSYWLLFLLQLSVSSSFPFEIVEDLVYGMLIITVSLICLYNPTCVHALITQVYKDHQNVDSLSSSWLCHNPFPR